MEKVQAGSITEEFSFSRALHLIKHSGEKVRHVAMSAKTFIFIDNNKMFLSSDGKVYDTHNPDVGFILPSDAIVGNWTIYDERIHG